MYEKMGYSIYRRVLGYYSGEEDAFDMRKARNARAARTEIYGARARADQAPPPSRVQALPRDVHKRSIIPLTKPITPDELEW